ncbi:hypothetical protein ACKA01_07275 [Helcococcus kunzii]|uniref:hypothetical protein n=1 Tax=Helcococcus kunzii TaxID=40091 RepID=UPI0038AEF5CA
MKCFNCGNDADMEVFMMVNGKMKKISICMECYQEQLQSMMGALAGEDGEFDPEEVQRKMFEFFQNNKDEFEKFIGEAINDENFDMNNLNSEDFDISDMNFENSGFNLTKDDLNDIFGKFNNAGNNMEYHTKPDYDFVFNFDRDRKDSFDGENNYSRNQETKERLAKQREMRLLKKAVEKKREEMNRFVEKEDYLAAATSRDEMREINKKIMIIKQIEKEGETQ